MKQVTGGLQHSEHTIAFNRDRESRRLSLCLGSSAVVFFIHPPPALKPKYLPPSVLEGLRELKQASALFGAG